MRGIHSLDDGEVHVWSITLDAEPAPTRETLALLSPEERSRAERFRFDRDRRRYVAAHAAVRLILARYCAADPAHLEFAAGPKGKPALAGEVPTGLRFNLSHSHELALLATARGREVGVDLEHHRSLPDAFAIAERFFSRREIDALRAVPEDERTAGFFRCWTRKEAFVKALGGGLSRGLDRFSVSLGAGDARLLDVSWDEAEAGRWRLQDLAFQPAYSAALAVEARGEAPLVSCLEWRTDL